MATNRRAEGEAGYFTAKAVSAPLMAAWTPLQACEGTTWMTATATATPATGELAGPGGHPGTALHPA
jgi:hypothetical protein